MKTLLTAAALLATWMCYPACGQDAPPLRPDDVLTVAVTPAMPVAAELDESFLGMTYYYGSLQRFFGDRPLDFNPALVQLLQNLTDLQGPPLVRIGGGSVNETWYNPNGAAQPSGIEFDLTPDYLTVIKDTLSASGTKGIFCLNVGANDVGLFEDMGNGFRTHVGDAFIEGFEIGNEPNRYEPNNLREDPYDFDDFSDELDTFLTAYETNVSSTIPSFGPTFTMTSAETVEEDLEWNARAPEFITRFQDRLGSYSMNRYPLSDCTGNPASLRFPSIPNLLKDRAAEGQALALEPNIVEAHDAGLPFYIMEHNSASCSGTEEVSDTFASALWFIDSAFAYADRGVDKLFVPSSFSAHYNPFVFDRDVPDSGSDPIIYTPRIYPIYYGMLLFAEAVGNGSTLREIEVNSPETVNTKAWATTDQEGNVHVMLLNKDLTESGNVRIYIPGSQTDASLVRLVGPSIEATDGLTLGGQTFDGSTDGQALGSPSAEIISPDSNGIYTVFLGEGSAALLKLSLGDALLGAGAGLDQTIGIGQSITLDGTDSYGNVDTYTWVQTNGPTTRLLSPDTATPQFTAYDSGVYTFELSVANSGESATDTVTITVTEDTPLIYIEDNGTVAFEAEAPSNIAAGSGDFIDHTWTIISDQDASGGDYLKCTPDNAINAKETADGPALEYQIHFTTIGSYQVHVRTARGTSASDSFHVGLESPVTYPKGLKASDDWGWETEVDGGSGNATIEILTPGIHTFRVWPREDGCWVDRIVLSQDPGLDPDTSSTSSLDESHLAFSARALFEEAVLNANLSGDNAEALAVSQGDALPNLLKYAFNLDLASPDALTLEVDGTAGLPAHEILTDSEGQTLFRVRYLRRRGSSLIYAPMRSTTPDAETFVSMTGPMTVTIIDPDWELVTIDEMCDATTARCFAHVRVSFPNSTITHP